MVKSLSWALSLAEKSPCHLPDMSKVLGDCTWPGSMLGRCYQHAALLLSDTKLFLLLFDTECKGKFNSLEEQNLYMWLACMLLCECECVGEGMVSCWYPENHLHAGMC